MRYLPLTDTNRKDMCKTIGVDSVDALFADVPKRAVLPGLIEGLPHHASEMEVEHKLATFAGQNQVDGPFFAGAGTYRHHIPASVDYLIQRGELLTAYTPYQPEVSQGTLQILFEFQTQVALLTGMEVANASMYDGSTSTVEAAMMAMRLTKRAKCVLSGNLHPHYREVIETTSHTVGFEVQTSSPTPGQVCRGTDLVDDSVACLVVQTPDLFGLPYDLRDLAEACHKVGALLVVVTTEVISLGMLASPGSQGADIVAAEGQSIGNAVGFGGPHVGLLACQKAHLRQIPGRLCGESVDEDGRRGFVLTLAAREQHIRREKATSNICTNSGLCATAFSIHLSLLGESGLARLARLNHAKAQELADILAKVPGVTVLNKGFFNEFTLRLKKPATAVVQTLAEQGICAGVPVSRLMPKDDSMQNLLLVTATELTSSEDMQALAHGLKGALS
ncbi:MAG: aminomethyl-transferring glycine dehydrogenase subunit GcvPA [Pseudomonadota bacterium]